MTKRKTYTTTEVIDILYAENPELTLREIREVINEYLDKIGEDLEV